MGDGYTGVIWHGRGGQGAFTAARLLGASYVSAGGGRRALAFPAFGPERRGAPIRAFTKMSETAVSNRSEMTSADFTVYLDSTLFRGIDDRCTGTVLVNTADEYGDPRIISFDASALAASILGSPMSNTAMVGALAAIWSGGISIESVRKGIEDTLPEHLRKDNIKVAEKAFRAAGCRH